MEDLKNEKNEEPLVNGDGKYVEKKPLDDGRDFESDQPIINGNHDEPSDSIEEKNKVQADQKEKFDPSKEKFPEVMDVFSNGDLLKKRLKDGTGVHTRPNFGEVCTINVTTKLLDGSVLDKKSNYKCVLGHLECVQALDLCLMLMEIGELAEVTSIKKFTMPKLDFNPKLAASTDKLVYEVELVDVDPIPNYSSMSSEEIKTVLIRKKELGNFSMVNDDHTTALSTYNYAKEIVDQSTTTIDSSLKVAIWNNMAACYLKMQNFKSVVDYTNKSLLLDPTNVKSLFRKGKALGQLGEYKDALEVLNKGIKIAPEKDLKLFHQAASEIKSKMNQAQSKEKAMYKAMFGQGPDSKSSKKSSYNKVTWLKVGAVAAVVVAIGAALIKVNLSSS